MNIALWVIGCGWALYSAAVVFSFMFVPRLRKRKVEGAPRVTAVVAARDEAGRIEQTVERLLAQEGVDLRVVVGDDRSVDETPEILHGLAEKHERLDVERVDELPEGWLGKCHALHRGAVRATAHEAEWLLFVDADVWLSADATARAVAVGEDGGFGHVTLLPRFARSAGLGRPAALAGLATFMVRSALCNFRVPGQQVGIGGFNLIRREAYELLGGHEALRLEIVDDLYLAVLANRAGARTRVLRAFEDVEIEYATSLANLLAVTRKNNFAIFRYRTVVASVSIAAFLVVWLGALVGPLIARPGGWVALGGVASTAVANGVIARRLGWGVWPALPAAMAQGALPLMLVNSMVATLREGGVRWRETFYPLALLRRERVR